MADPRVLLPFDLEVIPWPTYHNEWALCLTKNLQGRCWIEHRLINSMIVAEGRDPENLTEIHDMFVTVGDKIIEVLNHLPPLEPSQVRIMKFVDNPVVIRVGYFGKDLFIFLPRPEFEQEFGPPEFDME